MQKKREIDAARKRPSKNGKALHLIVGLPPAEKPSAEKSGYSRAHCQRHPAVRRRSISE
jgi:hypothetical protein